MNERMNESLLTTMEFKPEVLIILVVSLSTVFVNVLTLLVLFRTDMLGSVNRYFFASLTCADLLIGLLVAPFSLWASIFGCWIYGEPFCNIEAYLAAILWIGSVYSLAWQSVDHYVATRKPDRYESLMTSMRSRCWVTMVWVAAFSFCCPPLFGVGRAKYYKEAFVCIIDWDQQKAYVVTSGLLIVIPPIIALAISNLYIFTANYKSEKSVAEKCSTSNARHDQYLISFLVGMCYLCAWLPWCSLQLYEVYRGEDDEQRLVEPSPHLHFYLMWLAISNSALKFFVYVLFDQDFRAGLKMLFAKAVCSCQRTTAL